MTTFCQITDWPFILNFLLLIFGWIMLIIGATAISDSEKVGIIMTVVVVLAYFAFTIDEFKSDHMAHGIISLIPILLIMCLIIVGSIKTKKIEKIRTHEKTLIPQRVEKYINENGYTAPHLFALYLNSSPEFAIARSVKYPNPLYSQQIKENEQRKANNEKPLPITATSEINYGEYAAYKYKEIVLTYFMKELPNAMNLLYMFDYDDVYQNMPDFSSFFKKENNSVDMEYFKKACLGITNQLISDEIIERVGSNDLFRSKIIPISESNVIEGEVIEL